jgi:hypothetical protein
MEQVSQLIEYVANRPGTTFVAGIAVAAVLYFFIRKPKTVRDARARMRELKDERAGQYNSLRPPK